MARRWRSLEYTSGKNDFGPTESALATWSRVLPRPRRDRLLVSNAVMDFRGNQPLFR